jgi:hypothetical protein
MTMSSSGCRFGLIAAGLAALVLALAACGSRADKDQSTEKTVQDFVHRVNKIVRNDEASWPDDVPDGVPEFTQGKIVSAQKGLTANGTSWTICVSEVEEGGFDAYFDSLKSGGWETTIVKSEGGGSYSARTESLGLSLNFSGDQGTLVIRLTTF